MKIRSNNLLVNRLNLYDENREAIYQDCENGGFAKRLILFSNCNFKRFLYHNFIRTEKFLQDCYPNQ
jgi:hypothetical protein